MGIFSGPLALDVSNLYPISYYPFPIRLTSIEAKDDGKCKTY